MSEHDKLMENLERLANQDLGEMFLETCQRYGSELLWGKPPTKLYVVTDSSNAPVQSVDQP